MKVRFLENKAFSRCGRFTEKAQKGDVEDLHDVLADALIGQNICEPVQKLTLKEVPAPIEEPKKEAPARKKRSKKSK
jgi:hypothetical protein